MIKTRRWAVVAAALALGACAHSAARTATPAPGPATGAPAAETGGTVEQRLARLEAAYARNAEALDFLNKVYAQQKAQQEESEAAEPADDAVFAVDVADAVQQGRVDGPPTAAVTIVKAFDFACPFCQRVAPVLDELIKDYRGKVRVVYLNMVVHPQARPAHLAGCAAARQGKYKQFKDAFWDKGYGPYAQANDPELIDDDHVVAIAKAIGLDTAKLKADMASPACADQVKRDMDELARFHVNATPTFFINGKQVSGALPKDEFKRRIDDQLAIVEHSGVPAASYYAKVVVGTGEKQFRGKRDPRPPAAPAPQPAGH